MGTDYAAYGAALAGKTLELLQLHPGPYSSRIRAARFEFEGHIYQLKPNTPEGNTQRGRFAGPPLAGVSHGWFGGLHLR